ncbi:MAG: Omp28-related outer membrane protein [Ignavibacteria bacterium]|jgi:hypothetical protein
MRKLFTIILFLFITGFGNAQTNNVLLEFCTGTWCQWCPCGDAAADSILVYHPDALILAYHGGSSSEPFKDFIGSDILTLMSMSSYPNATIGRRTGLLGYSGWFGQANIQTNNYSPSPVSYSFNRHYNPSTRTVDLTVVATALRDIDTNCNVNFVIYENNLVYPQTGNSTCPGSSTWVHKWVVRNMVNSAAGESISTGHWASGTTKTKTWTTTLNSAWVYSNCSVGLFVYMIGNNLSYNSPVLQTAKEDINTFPTGIENPAMTPLTFNLAQNYPNPFNPTTNIHFSVPKDGIVTLKVYDVLGNVVSIYSDGFMKAGTYNAEFDGSKLASGVYFYKLTAGESTSTRKMILTK